MRMVVYEDERNVFNLVVISSTSNEGFCVFSTYPSCHYSNHCHLEINVPLGS